MPLTPTRTRLASYLICSTQLETEFSCKQIELKPAAQSNIFYLIKLDEVSITISKSVQCQIKIIIFVLGLGDHRRDSFHQLIIHGVYQPREIRLVGIGLNISHFVLKFRS